MHALLLLLVFSADPKLPTGEAATPQGPNPFLAQARENYEKLDYELCLKRIAQAPQWKSTPKELVEIELYAGLCHYNLNQRAQAEERFRLALRIDEGAELPPYTSPRAVDFFLSVKKKLQPVAPPMPDEDLPDATKPEPAKPEVKKPEPAADGPDAPRRVELTPKPRPDPLRAPSPGSLFARKHAAAIALTGVALLSAAVGVGLGANAQNLATRANAARYESEFHALGESAKGQATAANVFFGVAGAAAIGAIVAWIFEAQ